MLKWYAHLPVRKRVGILAILLGILAIFAGNPYNRATTRVNLKELSLTASETVNKVTVSDLADWIIKGNLDYRLVDLRNEKAYSKYHIPTAENIPVESLLDSDLMRNEKIILYSDDETIASQALFILKADDYRGVYILKGGLDAWKNEVLFPAPPVNPTKEQLAEFEKKKGISKFFGGQPRIASEQTSSQMKEPEIISAPPKITITKKRKKKAREGC